MRYIKYTKVDSVTNIGVDKGPCFNGPTNPLIPGLVELFALESQYPTQVPILYGEVPDNADISVEGVLEEISLEQYNKDFQDEMNARLSVAIEKSKKNCLEQWRLASRKTKELYISDTGFVSEDVELVERCVDAFLLTGDTHNLKSILGRESIEKFCDKIVSARSKRDESLCRLLGAKRAYLKAISKCVDEKGLIKAEEKFYKEVLK